MTKLTMKNPKNMNMKPWGLFLKRSTRITHETAKFFNILSQNK